MLNRNIQPTSIVGIKRLAKAIKAELFIPHAQALNEAARRAGYESFRHADNKLSESGASLAASPRHRLYITGFWKDRDSGTSGRETTWVDLSVAWTELVTRRQMLAQRSLVRLSPEAEDHLSYQYTFSSQSQARRAACAAVRTFLFMDATKLRPSAAHSRMYPGGDSRNAIPGQDHSSCWYDPVSKGYVLADEPYEPAIKCEEVKRAAWAEKHLYDVIKPNWPGMYNPGGSNGSRLYLITSRKKGTSVNKLATALDRLPPPMLEQDWVGKSANGMERFKSPAELRKTNTPLPQEKVTRQPQHPNQARALQALRPGRMSVESHEEIGRRLKSVMADTLNRDGVYKRLETVRSTLDDWIQQEYDEAALPSERFFEVYYGAAPKYNFTRSLTPEQIAQHVGTLEFVKMEIARHYTQTKAKSIMGKIDSSIKSLQSWTT